MSSRHASMRLDETTMNLPAAVWTNSLLILLLLQLISTSSPPRGIFFEDTTRLGSTPPSCHNKCNHCHPCVAVQVPSTMPGRAARVDSPPALPMGYFDSSSEQNRYSFYKPLGWKCRCKNHFFNP